MGRIGHVRSPSSRTSDYPGRHEPAGRRTPSMARYQVHDNSLTPLTPRE